MTKLAGARRLVGEVDGAIHNSQTEQDEMRTEQLEGHAYRILRFGNEQVMSDLDGVPTAIRLACLEFVETDAPQENE